MLEDKKVNEKANAANKLEGVVTTKTCTKCGEVKCLGEFGKNKKMKDGRLNTCKVCKNAQMKEHNAKDEVKKAIAAKKTAYYEANKESIAAQHRKYRSSDEGKAAAIKSTKKQHTKSPEKQKAVKAVNNAIRDGKLTRPCNCSHCGKEGKIQAHHWSYEEVHWLDVIWLCKKCHVAEHRLIDANDWPSSKRLLFND